jgi:hypothetical protein
MSRADLHFMTRDDGAEHRLLFDSTVIYVAVQEVGPKLLVSLRCAMLEEVDENVPGAGKLLGEVNDINCASTIGKACWYADENRIMFEHWFPGESLEPEEFLGTLRMFVYTADARDDALRDALGTGMRGKDVVEREQARSGGIVQTLDA